MYEMEGASPARIAPGKPVTQPLCAAPDGRMPGLPALSRIGRLPSLSGPTGRPPVPWTRGKHRFPGSSHVPGVASGRYPFPTVKHFYCLGGVPRKGLRQSHYEFLAVHMLSTEDGWLCATGGGYPPA